MSEKREWKTGGSDRRARLALLAVGAALLLSGLLVACGGATATPTPAIGSAVKTEGGSYQSIGPAELMWMFSGRRDYLLVNVHIPYEGQIYGTDLFIPYDQIEQNLSKLPADKRAKIILYCRSGHMSAIAARTMVRLGFTNVYDLAGGMIDWQARGYEVIYVAR